MKCRVTNLLSSMTLLTGDGKNYVDDINAEEASNKMCHVYTSKERHIDIILN